MPTQEELIAELKTTYGVDVAALTAQVETLSVQNEGLVAELAEAKPAVELSAKLSSALVESDFVKLSAGEELTGDSIVGSIVALGEENISLSAKLETYIKSDAEHTVDALVAEGRIIPAQRDAMIELRLSNEEMFDKLVPEAAVVELSAESGTSVTDEDSRKQEEDIDAEVARLSATLR